MKVAIIGLGDIACKAYLPLVCHWPDVEPVLCTRNSKTLTALAKQYRISTYCEDYRQLPSLNIDAVMIHSATHAHFEIASFFLNLGIPTFVDKPLSDNVYEVEKLYELAFAKATPLFVGFNRRHIPLFQQQLPNLQQGKQSDLLSLRWEKHRHQLPGEWRSFIFDDFIHPLDAINIDAKASLDDVSIEYQSEQGKLARLDVRWQSGGCLFHASMNRQFGCTLERVQIGLQNRVFEFDSFVAGRLLANEQVTQLTLKDWTPMLDSKGFYAMLTQWFSVVREHKLELRIAERNIASHRLAEAIYQQVLQAAKNA